MQLLPIDIDDTKNNRFRDNPDCVDLLDVYPGYYQLIGYNPPWIGYVAVSDIGELVGAGSYKGTPKDGKVEIAYTTFNPHEGQGMGTEICRQLVLLSLQTDPSIQITARTLPNAELSKRILARNGFNCQGTIYDEEDGEVLDWKLTDIAHLAQL